MTDTPFPLLCCRGVHIVVFFCIYFVFCSSVDKESAFSGGDPGLIPGLERSPGEGNGNPLRYPCLENLMGRRAWWAAVHGVTKESGMTEGLTHLYFFSQNFVIVTNEII